MSLALARDKLGYDEEQLASLSRQIRLGDFTPVLRLYEEDIKFPIKSVLTGTCSCKCRMPRFVCLCYLFDRNNWGHRLI